jgi:hypothetical protein
MDALSRIRLPPHLTAQSKTSPINDLGQQGRHPHGREIKSRVHFLDQAFFRRRILGARNASNRSDRVGNANLHFTFLKRSGSPAE